jgi:predicted nucleotidyltransferase
VRRRLGARVRSIILFGSRARGDAREGSDYDMLLVLAQRTDEARAIVLDIERDILDRHGELVASLIRGEDEWRRAQGFPLALNVAREGIAL